MAKRVLIHVENNGKTKIEAEGFEGGTCLDATAAFEAMFSKTEAPREMVGECAPRKDFGERVNYG